MALFFLLGLTTNVFEADVEGLSQRISAYWVKNSCIIPPFHSQSTNLGKLINYGVIDPSVIRLIWFNSI